MVALTRLVSPQVPRLTPPPHNRTKPRVSNRIACYRCSARAPPRLSDLQAPLYPRAPATSIASSASFCVPSVYQICGLHVFHAHPARLSDVRAPHLPRAPCNVHQICGLHVFHACPFRSAGSMSFARALQRPSDLQAPHLPRLPYQICRLPPCHNSATESNITRQCVLAYKTTLQFVQELLLQDCVSKRFCVFSRTNLETKK